ncbi:amidohydrolase [Pontibacter cellulosilyticus]|uniref:Amidohydrolase n=1 Tax=Pontibacter cellulosilyticus TaxID=1720253 RepID=A0A923N4I2_9BACT|nr:amidohydrolase [Pontibacter cellulosilyticus]MBC5991587.1 amidohydrolase [Pontibacter cellulosilyticus]
MQQPLPDFTDICTFRQDLHKHPELSGNENLTAARIIKFLEKYKPDCIISGLGGTGVTAIFEGEIKDGPAILFRAELDALPILEVNDMQYTSTVEGVSHKCGHDGHMAILAGLAKLLHRKPITKGKIILLFQPAEETGQGAWAVLKDDRFGQLEPDYVFALHNLPGFTANQVVVREHTFAAASTGMIVELFGLESHAAEPENGLNPGQAMAELILAFNNLILDKSRFKDLTLLTVIHARLGEIAFGTNPGFATVMATLRSFQQADLDLLKNLTTDAVKEIAGKYNLRYKISFTEEFPATVNHQDAVNQVKAAAKTLELDLQEAVNPFKWSEDFGHFTRKYKGALFGLGAGTHQSQLHHADYDFPDSIIPTGATLFYTIASGILNK